MVGLIDVIKKQAKNSDKRLIFPEGEDDRIIQAASAAIKYKYAKPILIGNKKVIEKKAKTLKSNLRDAEIIDISESKRFEKYVSFYSKKLKVAKKTAALIIKNPLFFSATALAAGDAEGMVAGAVYASGDVIAVSKKVIGLRKGISVPSSFFIMVVPGYKGGEKGALLYADASVNPNPNANELADIAVASGMTAKTLLKWKPRVAILSFSTKGSADHKDVTKVIKATDIAKKKARGFDVDGELQGDSALVMSTAKKKIHGKIGKVAGRANVLVFPDLDAGNIAYKLTQTLAKSNAYGPILQGFAKPVSDLSRGAKVEDIIGVIAIVALTAKRWKK